MKYKNILVEAIMNLGDLVALTAIIPVIKEYNPEARITFLVKEGFDDLLDKVPSLDKYMVYIYKSGGDVRGVWKLSRQIKAESFDCFLSLDPRFRTEIAAFLGGIPQRLTPGSVFGWPTKTYLFTKRIDMSDYNIATHTTSETCVEATRRLLGVYVNNMLGTPRIEDRRPPIMSLLQNDRPYITLSIATKSKERSWAAANWSELVNRLAQMTHKRIVLIGTKEDCTLSATIKQNIKEEIRLIDLCGKTTLDELINTLAHSDLSINIDNGIGHLAAALGRPTVTLFPTADPRRFIPVGPFSVAVKSEVITVNDVLQAISSLDDKTSIL